MAQTSATCSNGDDPASVTVGAGETVTCTFTNTKLGSITIVKVAENGNGVFPFYEPDAGRLHAGDGGQPDARGRRSGSSRTWRRACTTCRRRSRRGWVFVSQSCSDGSDPNAIDLGVG